MKPTTYAVVRPTPTFPIYRFAVVLGLGILLVLGWRSYSLGRERAVQHRAAREQRLLLMEEDLARKKAWRATHPQATTPQTRQKNLKPDPVLSEEESEMRRQMMDRGNWFRPRPNP